jgi:hypothetical protein
MFTILVKLLLRMACKLDRKRQPLTLMSPLPGSLCCPEDLITLVQYLLPFADAAKLSTG